MTKKQEVALKLLKGAKKHLRKDGWHQGWYQADPGGDDVPGTACCILGAFNRAAWDEGLLVTRDHFIATLTLDGVVPPHIVIGSKKDRKKRLGTDRIQEWNDEEVRTKKDVIEFIDERIRILEAA